LAERSRQSGSASRHQLRVACSVPARESYFSTGAAYPVKILPTFRLADGSLQFLKTYVVTAQPCGVYRERRRLTCRDRKTLLIELCRYESQRSRLVRKTCTATPSQDVAKSALDLRPLVACPFVRVWSFLHADDLPHWLHDDAKQGIKFRAAAKKNAAFGELCLGS
jgi:hypothetical protein